MAGVIRSNLERMHAESVKRMHLVEGILGVKHSETHDLADVRLRGMPSEMRILHTIGYTANRVTTHLPGNHELRSRLNERITHMRRPPEMERVDSGMREKKPDLGAEGLELRNFLESRGIGRDTDLVDEFRDMHKRVMAKNEAYALDRTVPHEDEVTELHGKFVKLCEVLQLIK